MKTSRAALLLVVALPSFSEARDAAQAPALRRLVLVAGANRGAASQPPLRYAVSDAERFARVLTSMGGVAPLDATVLREPGSRAFQEALADLSRRAAAARAGAARVEVLVYFSGHADEHGLLFGTERFPYRELRTAISQMPVDVGIAVLDACASGAITRLKGGQLQPGFLSDISMAVQGYAFLASSSESETAQESDRLGGSYFTHAFLTGLRGAADVTGDGRVTLGEAYQFAFNETLSQTTTTQGGAQHPSYDIKMAGTGDVVMTDVRKIAASLILGADYDGRFYVLDAAGRLVAEMHKPAGRTLELGLEPGEYRVYYRQSEALLSSPLKLDLGQRQELVRGGMRPTRRLPTMKRGLGADPDGRLGRWRLESALGIPGAGTTGRDGYQIHGSTRSLSLLHWLRPTLALEGGLLERKRTDESPRDTSPPVRTEGFVRGAFAGGRYSPRVPGPVQPFVATAFGAFDVPGRAGLRAGILSAAGTDIRLGRLLLSFQGSFNKVSGEMTQIETRVGLGWQWGRRKTPTENGVAEAP